MDDGRDAVWADPFFRGDYTGEYGFDNEFRRGVLPVCNMWVIWQVTASVLQIISLNIYLCKKDSGGSQPRINEGASHYAQRDKNAEAFLNIRISLSCFIFFVL